MYIKILYLNGPLHLWEKKSSSTITFWAYGIKLAHIQFEFYCKTCDFPKITMNYNKKCNCLF